MAWDHSHINNDTHRLPHIRPYIFTPYISPKPLFLPKIVTQSHSVTLSKCPEFWKFVTQRLLIGWNLRKRYPNAAYFVMAFVTERPPIFLPCIHMFVWGECCLKHGQKLENFVFSKQNRAIWGIGLLSGANLIKVMKIKFHFYRLDDPIVHYMDEFHWRAGMIQATIHLFKHGRGYILQTPSINLHPWLSKQMPSVSEDVWAEAF